MDNSEAVRLKELYNLHILDTEKEIRFDRYTKLVGEIFNIPIVLVTLIDLDRQWFKSCIGVDIEEMPRSISFCSYAIKEKEILVVFDMTKDARFYNHTLVINPPHVRFYAGAVLRGPTGQPLGTLCMLDTKSRNLSEKEQNHLMQFAKLVEHELSYNYHLNEMRNKIEQSLYYNQASGLPNRRFLKEHLLQEISAVGTEQYIAVVAVSINRLKDLQTVLGDEAFHFILNEIANALKYNLDNSTKISHWHDDLILLFVSMPFDMAIVHTIKKIQKTFINSFCYRNEKYTFTSKIGISIFPSDDTDAEQLLDKAIYSMQIQAKDNKNTYRLYSDQSTKKVIKEYQLESLLIRAIEEETLEVVYQPKVDTQTGHIIGAEALCRWHTTEFGNVSPVIFIQIAEQSDLIVRVGNYVLNKACYQNALWQNNGLKKIPISVNVTNRQLLELDFVKNIQKILLENHLDATYLDLEITESVFVQLETALSCLNEIRELGITLSLDDFGTGFSSLSYLQKMPLKALKIDKAFIANIHTNANDFILVKTIIAMANSLNFLSVVEGVENAEQYAQVKKLNCSQIQGYYFSKPLTADAFTSILLQDKTLLPILECEEEIR